mgnify:CR=1 FL=1
MLRLIILILLIIEGCTSVSTKKHPAYVYKNPYHYGVLSKTLIESHAGYSWFNKQYNKYIPQIEQIDEKIITLLKSRMDVSKKVGKFEIEKMQKWGNLRFVSQGKIRYVMMQNIDLGSLSNFPETGRSLIIVLFLDKLRQTDKTQCPWVPPRKTLYGG